MVWIYSFPSFWRRGVPTEASGRGGWFHVFFLPLFLWTTNISSIEKAWNRSDHILEKSLLLQKLYYGISWNRGILKEESSEDNIVLIINSWFLLSFRKTDNWTWWRSTWWLYQDRERYYKGQIPWRTWIYSTQIWEQICVSGTWICIEWNKKAI